jgi:uncharacterized protein (DUF1778 family)
MDKRVNLRVSEKIGKMLDNQAEENGMNLSAYISHLVLQVEQAKENKTLMNNMINKMPSIDLEFLQCLKTMVEKKEV